MHTQTHAALNHQIPKFGTETSEVCCSDANANVAQAKKCCKHPFGKLADCRGLKWRAAGLESVQSIVNYSSPTRCDARA